MGGPAGDTAAVKVVEGLLKDDWGSVETVGYSKPPEGLNLNGFGRWVLEQA